MLLKEDPMCASPTVSIRTLRFLVCLVCFLAITNYYLVAFFLLATVFLLPFLVRELFFVRCPRSGNPKR